MKVKDLLIGAAYYTEYMPYERVEKDMQLMKEAGINTIRIAESTWSTWEPQDNTFDFSKLHHVLSMAEKYGLNVIIGTPTYAVPSWLIKKYPDIMAITKHGQEIYGGRQHFDLTNPVFRKYCQRITQRLMEEQKNYKCVIGFQLDNETRAADAANPGTQKLFVEYLKKKYPDINEFNHEFGLDYWSNRVDNWDDFPDIRGTINGSLSAAYKKFLREVITDFLSFLASIVREYMRPDQFITHNFDYAWDDHSVGLQPLVDQPEAAECMDIAGCDIYHKSNEDLTGIEIDFGGAIARSLKKDNYLVLETACQGLTQWLPYPGQIRLQAYSHLSSGADSIMYWHWHSIHNAIESYWKGILSHDLKPNREYYEIKEYAGEMNILKQHLLHLTKKADAAILLDQRSLTGLDEFPINSGLNYNQIFRWMHDTCYKMNLETDIIYKDSDFSEYKLLFIPALYSATKETIEKLRAYVLSGGHLILGFKSCFSDEELKIYDGDQPFMMTDLIGASYSDFTYPKNTGLLIKNSSGEETKASLSKWIELLIPSDAEVWARYDNPFWKNYAAITHKKNTLGSVTYLGCFFEEKELEMLIRRVIREEKINIHLKKEHFPVIVKEGLGQNLKKIRYIFNYSNHAEEYCHEASNEKVLLNNNHVLPLDGNEIVRPGDILKIEPWNLIILSEI